MSLTIKSATRIETADIIRNFLGGQYSGALATADSTGVPHVAAVYFMLEDDFSLTFSTKQVTQKYQDIKENDRVAFLVYDEHEQTSIQIIGRAERVEDSDKRQRSITNMFKLSAERSDTGIPPAEKLWGGEYVVLRLVPAEIKMAVYARPDSEENDDLYESLTFKEDA